MTSIIVEYGNQGDEAAPARFGMRTETLCEVDEVVDRWPGDGYVYYKLRSHGALYILRHDETEGDWELQFFQDEERDFGEDSPLVEY
jgi:hypothetical protein